MQINHGHHNRHFRWARAAALRLSGAALLGWSAIGLSACHNDDDLEEAVEEIEDEIDDATDEVRDEVDDHT